MGKPGTEVPGGMWGESESRRDGPREVRGRVASLRDSGAQCFLTRHFRAGLSHTVPAALDLHCRLLRC